MRKLQNTLFVTTDETFLSKEGEAVELRRAGTLLGRVPLINLESIATFGWNIVVTPELMAACAERGIAISFHNAHGKFLAAVHGFPHGNVVLRRKQFRAADDADVALGVARRCIQAKLANCRTLLRRAARENNVPANAEKLALCADLHQRKIREAGTAKNTGELRGIEGDAAASYFENFNLMITNPDEKLRMNGRSRRPPRDAVNAILSFLYTLLAHNCRSACASVGLDAQVGFLHADRPGRAGLALDLMEEFRPVLADRVALSLINRRQLNARDFQEFANGAILLKDDARKTLLQVWQERKREEIVHPILNEKIQLGLAPFVQARLLARFLRGDYEHYLPFLWR